MSVCISFVIVLLPTAALVTMSNVYNIKINNLRFIILLITFQKTTEFCKISSNSDLLLFLPLILNLSDIILLAGNVLIGYVSSNILQHFWLALNKTKVAHTRIINSCFLLLCLNHKQLFWHLLFWF